MGIAVQLTADVSNGGEGAAGGQPPFYKTLFSDGFRPFFLGGGLYAALAVAAWLAWLAIHTLGGAVSRMTIAEPPHLWHAHEMIFGFGAAALAGFLLTAAPSWTKRQGLRSQVLVLVFAVWVIGRAVMWSTSSWPEAFVAIADFAFLPLLGLVVWMQFGSRLKLRNGVFLLLVAVMATGNGLYHADRLEIFDGGMTMGVTTGLAALVLLITIVGGRTIPGFTKNALVRAGIEDGLPSRRGWLDAASILSVAVFFIAFVADAEPLIAGILAGVAAITNAIRFALWRTFAILNLPIVWVLHIGYAWLIVGMGLMAVALGFDFGSKVAALHAFGTGAVGSTDPGHHDARVARPFRPSVEGVPANRTFICSGICFGDTPRSGSSGLAGFLYGADACLGPRVDPGLRNLCSRICPDFTQSPCRFGAGKLSCRRAASAVSHLSLNQSQGSAALRLSTMTS